MKPSILSTIALAALAAAAADAQAQRDSVRFINPPSLSTPRGYSHVAEVPGGTRMVYIAGQVPVDSTGQLVGGSDFRAQSVQVFENLRRALSSVGARFTDVVKINIYVTDASQIAVLREVRDRYVNTAAPPASTLVEVRRLFREDVMLEIEAVAVVRSRE
jgi:enamine deaminase RidA (YjgF/YER057c/UK114 family)